jgi:hypothetical protein
LRTLLDNPETRTRIVRLIDKSVSNQSPPSKTIEKRQRDSNTSQKIKKVTADRRNRSQSDADTPVPAHPQSGMSPGAAGAIGTAIGIGVGLGRMGPHEGGMGGMRDR